MLKQIEEIRDTLFEYIETRIGLFKIETRERFEDIILKVIYGSILVVCSSVVLIFLLLLLAVFINEKLNNPYWGYVIVMGFFALCLSIAIIFKNGFLKFIRTLLETSMKEKNSNN